MDCQALEQLPHLSTGTLALGLEGAMVDNELPLKAVEQVTLKTRSREVSWGLDGKMSTVMVDMRALLRDWGRT
jgi:hypothetical protein